jgi:hypothetical protein
MNVSLSPYKWIACCIMTLIVMITGMSLVVQDTYWLAPPYLYNAAWYKLYILFAWLPLFILSVLLRPRRNNLLNRNILPIGFAIIISFIMFALCVFMVFIVTNSIPAPSFCQKLEAPPGQPNFNCKVPQWIDEPDTTFRFEWSDGAVFMRLIDAKIEKK